ncbi:MAG TPA: type II secretion system major pseudopilin GspG [Candidatus Binatia bacterium]|jgi:general secretion pathway protein G|nr:type II secretion system major pseudopilin GspG [Candidatus Binatia bacterium]
MRRRGFTLLEVMLVVLILGLLMAVAGPRLLGRTEQARRTRTQAELGEITQALGLYRLDGGSYPTTAQGLAALIQRPDIPPAPRHWRSQGYLPRPPVDAWGTPYVYASTDGTRYTLRSLGPDRAPGTDDVDDDAP